MSRKLREIIMSDFTMVPHADGGWAVPGGGRIEDHDAALDFAREWNDVLRRAKAKAKCKGCSGGCRK